MNYVSAISSRMFRTVAVATTLLALTPFANAETVLKASVWTPLSHVFVTGMVQPWAADVARVTEGRVRVEILPKAVSTPPGQIDAVRDGLADVAFGVHGYTPGRFVLSEMAEMPFLGNSVEAMSVAYQRIYEREIAKVDRLKDVKVLGVFTHGPGTFMMRRQAINKIDDLKGLTLRTGGGMVREVVRAIGANPLLKAAPESYELLSSGVVEGVLLAPDGLVGFSLQDIVKHITLVPGGLYNTSFFFVMNQKAFDSLSGKDRAAIDSISGEHMVRRLGRAQDVTDKKALEIAREKGAKITTADKAFVAAIKERTAGAEKAWVERVKKAAGIDGAALLAAFRTEIAKVQQEIK